MSPTLVFIDFEASSLDQESWPIEVGYATTCGREDDFLLQRQAGWPLAAWRSAAERLHGVSLADLAEDGIAPQAALARLAPLRHALVVSDAAAFDNHWLTMIAEAADQPAPFTVRDWDMVLPSLTRAERDVFMWRARASELRRHRAGADARIMRAVWREAWAETHAAWRAA